MALDILVFALPVIVLILVITGLLIGWSELSDPPTSMNCSNCDRWMINKHHRAHPVCMRCRVQYLFAEPQPQPRRVDLYRIH
ncbi:hypothetical protein [Nocardia miyunensis]|uniref:hypothetical protein n=1 Tax=Nocardia miyunensis TaxID=282684 RepID=UPI0008306F49|nr:hypothetical protein [Nocardia miyunensis]